MLTPRIVRVLDLTEDDLRAFQMGRDAGSRRGSAAGVGGAPAGGIELPLPDEPQIPDRPDAAPDADQPPRRRDRSQRGRCCRRRHRRRRRPTPGKHPPR